MQMNDPLGERPQHGGIGIFDPRDCHRLARLALAERPQPLFYQRPVGGWDRIAVRAGVGMAEQSINPRLELFRDDMFQFFRFGIHFVP